MTPEDVYEPNYRFTSKPRMNAEQSDWAGVINTTLNEALAGEESAREWFLENGEEFQFVCALADMNPAQVSEFAKRRLNGVVFSKPKAKPKAEPAKPLRRTKASRLYEHNGESHSIGEWSEITGIKYMTLRRRMYDHGWSVSEALTTEPGHNRKLNARSVSARSRASHRRYEYDGKCLTLREWSEETGISLHALKQRIGRMGWSIKEALTTPVLRDGQYIHAKGSMGDKSAGKPMRQSEPQSAGLLADARPMLTTLTTLKGYYTSAKEALKGAMHWYGRECAAKAADESKAQSASMVAHDSEKRTGEPLAERKEAA